MTRRHHRTPGYGFTAQMAQADFLTFTRWYDRRGLLERPTMAECESSFSQPDGVTAEAAPVRDAA